MTDPNHICDAYMHVARVNHYLVKVATDRLSLAELEAAEQLLIRAENAVSADKTVALALDLCEADTKAKRLGNDDDKTLNLSVLSPQCLIAISKAISADIRRLPSDSLHSGDAQFILKELNKGADEVRQLLEAFGVEAESK